MIIGLVGFMGSGKGTVGSILQERGYLPESFASGVKDVTSVMFGWPRRMLEGDTDESRNFRESPDPFWSDKFNRNFTPREALQKVGTECGRDIFHKDFWVLNLEHKINKSKNYVITDVRFPNEIEWIQSQGGVVIEVQRGQNPIWYQELVDNYDDYDFKYNLMDMFKVHESEWAWVGTKTKGLLSNHGTKEELVDNVNILLTKLKNRDNVTNLNYEGVTNEVI